MVILASGFLRRGPISQKAREENSSAKADEPRAID